MIDHSTLETLKAMRCSAMAAELERQISDPNTYQALGFEDRIGLIVDAEWNRRQQNKLQKCIKLANFALPSACIEEIEYFPVVSDGPCGVADAGCPADRDRFLPGAV